MKLKTCQICGVTNKTHTIHKTKHSEDIFILCSRHYQNLKKFGRFDSIAEEKKKRVCVFCGIDGQSAEILKTSKFGEEIDVCRKEYDLLWKYGRLKKMKENEYVEMDNHFKMIVYNKDGEYSSEAIFSKHHINDVKKYKWHTYYNPPKNKTRYIYRSDGARLHNIIGEILFGDFSGFSIDHIDRDGLNNTDENLRVADRYVQMANQGITTRNTSGVRGVSFSEKFNRWRARIQFKDISKEKWCDSFDKAVELRQLWEKERDEYLGI